MTESEAFAQRRFCCGRYTVRGGTIAIGVSYLVLCGISAGLYGWHLALLADPNGGNPWHPFWSWFDEQMAKAGVPNYGEIPIVKEMRGKVDDAYINHRSCLLIVTVTALVSILISALTSAMVIGAAVKNDPRPSNRRLLVPWLVYNIFGVVVNILLAVVVVIYFGIQFGILYGVITAVEMVLIMALFVYMVRIVWLYWKELGQRASDEGFDEVGLIKK